MNLIDVIGFCESPIEQQLARAIAEKFADFEQACMVLNAVEPFEYEPYSRIPHDGLAFLIPQATCSGADMEDDWTYRVDFLLVCGNDPMFRKAFAIECDGHEWHEKTKEQAARDKRRDRRLILDGIVPIRFSGSEIHRDADQCAEYIRSLAHSACGDVLGDQHTWRELKALRPRAGYTGGGLS